MSKNVFTNLREKKTIMKMSIVALASAAAVYGGTALHSVSAMISTEASTTADDTSTSAVLSSGQVSAPKTNPEADISELRNVVMEAGALSSSANQADKTNSSERRNRDAEEVSAEGLGGPRAKKSRQEDIEIDCEKLYDIVTVNTDALSTVSADVLNRLREIADERKDESRAVFIDQERIKRFCEISESKYVPDKKLIDLSGSNNRVIESLGFLMNNSALEFIVCSEVTTEKVNVIAEVIKKILYCPD